MPNQEVMYRKGQTQFSIKAKVLWSVLSDCFDELKRQFDEQAKVFFGNTVHTTLRKYRASSTARFTVVFQEWQNNPDRIDCELKDFVQKIVMDVTIRNKQN